MTRDYSKARRSSGGGSGGKRQRGNRTTRYGSGQRSRVSTARYGGEAPLPGWIWLAAGAAGGLLIAYLFQPSAPTPTLSVAPPPLIESTAPDSTALASGAITRSAVVESSSGGSSGSSANSASNGSSVSASNGSSASASNGSNASGSSANSSSNGSSASASNGSNASGSSANSSSNGSSASASSANSASNGSARNSSSASASNGTNAAATAASEPKPINYTFYKILPQSEVVIPEDELQRPKTLDQRPGGGRYYLQAGSFQQASDADTRRAELAMLGLSSEIEVATATDGTAWHRVRVGPYVQQQELDRARRLLQDNAIRFFTVKEPT